MNQVTSETNLHDEQEREENEDLTKLVKQHFELEGVALSAEEHNKQMDEEFSGNIVFAQGRYSVSLPFTERVNNLPTNY